MNIVAGRLLLAAALSITHSARSETMEFVSEHVPPFSIIENGLPGGPLTDVVRAVCKRMAMACNIKALPKRRLEAVVEAGMTEGQYPIARTPERESLYYFNAAVVNTEYAFYAMKGNAFRYSLPGDLAGRTVVAYGPSGTSQTLVHLVAGVKSTRVQLEIDNRTLLRKLARGRYSEDGLVMLNRDVAEYLQSKEGFERVEFAGVSAKIQYYIGLSRKTTKPDTAKRFFDAYDDLVRSGELREILGKYQLESRMVTPSQSNVRP